MDETASAPKRGTPEWRAEIFRIIAEVDRLAKAHDSPELRTAAAYLRLEEWNTP